MRLRDNFILILSLAGLTLTGCLEMELKVQPNHAAVGSTFSATTEVVQTGNDGERAMLFAVNKPTGWTINSVTFSSPEQGEGTFSYLGNETDADLAGAGGIDVGWEDSVETAHPSGEMMHWQMYLSDGVASSAASEEDPDTFHVTVNYTVDNNEGNYGLKYWVSYDNNGEHESESGTANDGRSIVVYDPTLSSLVTFTLDDQTWLNEDIRFKGSMSDWSTFQAYDDGTNGDATADDHIWTAQYAIITDGEHQWGAIDTDNGDGTNCYACDYSDTTGVGTWLISGPNPQFSVAGTSVSGTVDYVIPPDMAVSEGVVMFTVHDETGEWTDIMWKGSPTSWAVQQMYDDGTNGDEEAGDHIWTAQVAGVTAGNHNWGAIDTDNGDGTSCEACDDSDGTGMGTWLIVGDNPSFNLEDDLLTLHGSTDYVIEDVGGEEITKTVLFSVDMTEWLDEEGNEGMRAFNIANGDEVQVRGSFNGWGDCQECTMTRTPGTNFFSHAIEVTSLPDMEHSFAYYMHLSDASLASLAERFNAYDSEGNPAIVDWIGWETSPQYEGNRTFVLGEEDESNLVELPSESYYDAFPGSVVPAGTSIDVTFSIDMYGVEGFDASEDSVYLRTHDKWLNFSQGYSDGQDLNHYAAEAVGNGVYEFPVTLNGPVPWCIYYKWGWYDLSESTENDEAGGGLGGVPRIRYVHQSLNDNCAWPSSYRFPLDTEFYLDENDGQEAWDPESICMVLMANDESENTALPSDYRISNNYPNPFNPTTEMEFSLPIESDISFSVYSLTGEEIYSFDRSSVPGGNYKITWNGKNRSGIAVPSGVYLYEFRAGSEFRQVKKMTLLK
ncbi:MAG: choice-of-anchor X domain-containing protein [Candidatus Neomarinimicrobiota bacterium]